MSRINKCIELIEQNQAIFAVSAPELTYECGKEMSQTWADLIQFDFEHHPFDTVGLSKFMKGLKDGGPTPSGHLTPTVVTTLPSNAISPEEVRYNAWQARHVLSAGVHGILNTHARTAEAVKAFVQVTRYPFQNLSRNIIGEGLRGAGGQKPAKTKTRAAFLAAEGGRWITAGDCGAIVGMPRYRSGSPTDTANHFAWLAPLGSASKKQLKTRILEPFYTEWTREGCLGKKP